jgi:glycosyltransferase involved in cell wall biosynthesis
VIRKKVNYMVMKAISVIICAFNEESTIASVIESTNSCPYVDQIVVVNDGSTDSTGQIISHLSESIDLSYINLLPNRGKGFGMASGLELASGEIIVFLDADIEKLTYLHINKLILPILRGDADMVMGQPGQTFIQARYNPFKVFTGQRAVKRAHILPIMEDIRFTRFGVETYINLYYQSKNLNIRSVILEGLVHRTKFGKMKKGKAIVELIMEAKEILVTLLENTELVRKSILKQFKTKRITLKGI